MSRRHSDGTIPNAARAIDGVAIVLVAQVVTVLLGWWSVYLAGAFWGEIGTAHYLQWRRVSGSISPLILLGLTTAMARAIGRAHDRDEECRRISTSAFLAIGAVLLSFGFVAGWASRVTSLVLLGGEDFAYLARPLVVGIVGQSLAQAAIAFLRGHFRYRDANIIAIAVVGAVPSLAFVLFEEAQLERALWVVACVQFVVGGVVPGTCLVKSFAQDGLPRAGDVWKHLRDLLAFGVPRVPLLAFSAWMFNFPSWQVAHTSDWNALSELNTSLLVCRSSSLVTGALAFTLLPILAARLREEGAPSKQTLRGLRVLAEATVGLALLAALLLFVHGPEIARWVSGHAGSPESDAASGVVFLMVAGLLIADVMRVPLDARSTFPYAVFAMGGGAALLGISFFVLRGLGVGVAMSAALSLVLGFSTYGLLALATAVRVFGLRRTDAALAWSDEPRVWVGRAVPIGVGLGAYATRALFGATPVVAMLSCAVWLSVAVAVWWMSGCPWLGELVAALCERCARGGRAERDRPAGPRHASADSRSTAAGGLEE